MSIIIYYICLKKNMLYRLRNGKDIELTVEQFLSMNDSDFEYLESLNIGSEINDPFAISVLRYGSIDNDDYEKSLFEIELEEKLIDKDFYNEDELEV